MNSRLMSLNARYLTRVVAFADYPTMTTAAAAAFCDEAAIYRALAKVEDALGCRVYRRGCGGRGGRPRPPELNGRGKMLIRQFREILASYSALEECAGLPDGDFATPAARRKTAKLLDGLTQPAAGERH